jgi:hypothetical protein
MTVAGAIKNAVGAYNLRPLWQRRAAFGVIGAVGGFAYYYFIGCASGLCPISSNPYISIAYGSLMGLLVPVQKKKHENPPGINSR